MKKTQKKFDSENQIIEAIDNSQAAMRWNFEEIAKWEKSIKSSQTTIAASKPWPTQ